MLIIDSCFMLLYLELNKRCSASFNQAYVDPKVGNIILFNNTKPYPILFEKELWYNSIILSVINTPKMYNPLFDLTCLIP